jgi:NAD(P)-dependent dehydrogenase (short-subunit alcohol dehydrogenase family)
MQIQDRIFIVTGASSGIGLSTAMALSERGAKVALLARSSDALQELAQELPGSLPVTVDMTRFDRVREAVGTVHQHYGRIHGLVNNAGRSYAASIEEIEPAVFDEIFHLNVLGPIIAMQAVIPLVRAQRRRKHRQRQFRDCVHDDPALQRVLVVEAGASWI